MFVLLYCVPLRADTTISLITFTILWNDLVWYINDMLWDLNEIPWDLYAMLCELETRCLMI